MTLESRVSALVAPILEPLAAEIVVGLPDDEARALRAELERGLRGEARSLAGAADQGFPEDELRGLLARQVELELLAVPAEKRLAVVRSWTGAAELGERLDPLGIASRELVAKGRADDARARALALIDEVVKVARAAEPAALERERATVSVILLNCASVLTDGLLGPFGGGA